LVSRKPRRAPWGGVACREGSPASTPNGSERTDAPAGSTSWLPAEILRRPLVLQPDSAGWSQRRRHLDARMKALDIEDLEGLFLVLQARGRELFILELASEPRERRLAHEDLPCSSNSAQARTDVRSVPDHRITQGFRAADVACHERPGVDPHTD